MAAGKGTRMGGDLPKVMHEVAGVPMLRHVVGACTSAGCSRVIVIVGYKQELVRGALTDFGQRVMCAVQDQQLGTGHAVMCTRDAFTGVADWQSRDVFVLAGDGPLIRPETLSALLREHRSAGNSATLATAVIDDPTGYGRIVRDASGRFAAIVEHRDCTPAQLAVREVNPSYYCFRAADLFEMLPQVRRNASSGEYYITDVPGLLLSRGKGIGVIDSVPAEDILSINTPAELGRVDRIMRARSGVSGAAS